MKPESLLASAGINIGLAMVVLSLFSVLKKQPLNVVVYYPRRLARGEDVPPLARAAARGFSVSRLCPSFSWIPRPFRISEDEILRRCGLDALAVIRLFKLGINFFMVCSIVGLLVLVPSNYTCQQGSYQSKLSHSMDSFTISNVPKGSNRLWLHFSCLCFISFYVFYLLYKEYKGMLERRIQHVCNHRQRPDQFTVLVRGIPFCPEHKAHGCFVDHFFSKYHSHSYESYQMVYDGKDIEELLQLASSIDRKIKNLQQRIVDRKHGSRSIFSTMLQENVSQLEMQEEKLQEVLHKIQHLQSESILRKKELPAAFVSFRYRWGAALAAQTQQHENPLLWITEVAPEPRDVLWDNLAIPYRQMALHKVGVFVASSLLTIFFALPVTAVQGIVQFENLKKWLPPARAVQLM